MHALLYLSAAPLHADEVAETLGIARSNVGVGLKELLSWNLVQVTQTLGDRRDFFVAQRDPWEVVRIIVEGRKRRELDPTISFLKECTPELASDRDTPTYVKNQIAGQLESMETLMGWYESIRSLPRKTLLKMMRMGQRIAKIIGD